jgi:Porin subfamily
MGAAAALSAPVAVRASDLPAGAGAPIGYVRICDAYGAGFFVVPGSNACLRVGGFTRAEFAYTPGQTVVNASTGAVAQSAKNQDSTGMEIRARVDLDGRVQTAWGTAQTVIWLRATETDGLHALAASTNFSTGYAPGGDSATSVIVERAFIRFAGLTAGIATENFATLPTYMFMGNLWAGFPNGIKEFAYTAVFQAGFSATVALESRSDMNFNSTTGDIPAPSAVPTATPTTYVNQPTTGYNLVGNVRNDQQWGFVQFEGALGANSVSTLPSAAYDPMLGPKDYGAYAVGASLRYNLPFVAAGDQFNFMTAYGHGMNGLIMSAGTSSISDALDKRFFGGVIRVDSNLSPTAVSSSGAPLAYGTLDSWSVGAIYSHQWTAQWRSNVDLEYAQLAPPTAFSANAGTGLNTQLGRAALWQTKANLIWSPIPDFDIGLELALGRISQSIQNPSSAFVAAGSPGLVENQWAGEMRVERYF